MDENKAAGPGSIADVGIDPKPLLDGASDFEYIEVFNPLGVDFIGVFGVTRPAQIPISVVTDARAPGITQSEGDIRTNYGLDLRNPDHPGQANIQQKVTIKSGATLRLLGSQAQVVVRQLVSEIMQREGKRLQLADPHARRMVEERVVLSRGSVDELMGAAPKTIKEQLQEAVKEEHEEEFPDRGDASPSDGGGVEAPLSDGEAESHRERTVGRPEKTDPE